MTRESITSPKTTLHTVGARWWPLAASWLLMAGELPAVSAIIARLAEPDIHLAAYGGVVFPIALLIESPVIMFLAASTALVRDWTSYAKLRRVVIGAAATLTLLHVLIAATPLYFVVVEDILGVPAELVEPARWGLIILIPWSSAIAYRRFQQGVLIRFDHPRKVTMGTLVRMTVLGAVLAGGVVYGKLPGVVTGAAAVSAAVAMEAIFVAAVSRRVITGQLRNAPETDEQLTYKEFTRFYTPLALTSLLTLLIFPMGSAAVSRMPRPIESLAVWPVVSGLLFVLRSGGMAYQEVVVALTDREDAGDVLRRFAWLLSASLTILVLVVAATPLSGVWFETVSGLRPGLAAMGTVALWLGVLMPALTVLQHLYQGRLVHRRTTRAVTAAVCAHLTISGLTLAAGVASGLFPGLYVAMVAFTFGMAAQTLWLWWRDLIQQKAAQRQPSRPRA